MPFAGPVYGVVRGVFPASTPRSCARGKDPFFVMFEYVSVKAAVGWLCALPAVVLGATASNVAEQVVLWGGAITAAAVVWAKVIRPLIQGINNLNDAYHAAQVAEREIREIKEDLDEIKERLDAEA